MAFRFETHSAPQQERILFLAIFLPKATRRKPKVAVSLRRDEPLYGLAMFSLAHGPAPGIGTFGSAFFVGRENYKAPLGGARGLLWC